MSDAPLDETNPELLQRRALLRRAAWLLGGAVSAPGALAILQGCSAKESAPAPAVKLELLTPAELALVAELADIIIPRTATSGAKEAGVPAFIDRVLAAVYPADAQARFKSGAAEFEAEAQKHATAEGKAFLEQAPAQRVAFVKHSLGAALAGERTPKPFILMVRELTVLGYFTSQPGITENMEYQPVPTAYHGCVPLSQMKKHVYWE